MSFDPNDLKEMMQIFLQDSKERLDLIEEAVMALEARPGNQESLLTIYRLAHNLKGSAGCLGLAQVADFAHAVEDLLRCIQEGALPVNNRIVTLLLQSVDVIRTLVAAAVEGKQEINDDDEFLLKQLKQFIEFARPDSDDAPAVETPQTASETPAADDEIISIVPAMEYTGAIAPPVEDEESAAVDEHLETIEAQTPTASRNEGTTRSAGYKAAGEGAKTLRVDVDKLDRMLNLTGEIAIARGRLTQMMTNAKGQLKEELLEAQRGMDPLYMELQELVMKARMVPVGPTFRQFIRTVRDVASAHAKQATLSFEGEDVEVDMTVIEHLRDPLTHMIRNSIDHGIEMPDAREAKGKDPCGQILLRAYHESGSIVIEIIDDGAGLNRDRIIERARNHKLAAEPEKLSDQELFQFIFHPGFSTAETVTDLSGRGVGMDVVKRNIEMLRGFIQICSQPGAGTTFTIRVPLTLSIINGLKVGIAEQTYIIPMDTVVECLELPEPERTKTEGEGVINLRGRPLPYVRLKNFFEFDGPPLSREYVVVVQNNGGFAGIAVDLLYGESQTVIKSLGKLFQGAPGISGSAILGNGQVALILDVGDILRKAPGSESALVM
jgi:two-component system, chemotaxis family, sensor kinase CheA